MLSMSKSKNYLSSDISEMWSSKWSSKESSYLSSDLNGSISSTFRGIWSPTNLMGFKWPSTNKPQFSGFSFIQSGSVAFSQIEFTFIVPIIFCFKEFQTLKNFNVCHVKMLQLKKTWKVFFSWSIFLISRVIYTGATLNIIHRVINSWTTYIFWRMTTRSLKLWQPNLFRQLHGIFNKIYFIFI